MIEKVKDIICRFVDIEKDDIKEDSTLRADIGLNSLDLISVATEIENDFGVTISEKKVLTLKTVGDLVDCI
ncbi:MAG: acyl carrier protein [Clostridia bacterium]|nr:acyl carrier protein [Clostridia bacterium]